jgi:hypothetical protein
LILEVKEKIRVGVLKLAFFMYQAITGREIREMSQ